MSARASTSAPVFSSDLGNFNRVGWSFLAITLDAVGGDVVQQRGPMHRRIKMRDTRRTRVDQLRISTQPRLQSGNVPANDGLDGGFKSKDRRALLGYGFGVLHERRPTQKIIPTRYGELRVVDVDRSASDIRLRVLLGQPGDVRAQKSRVPLLDYFHSIGVAGCMGFDQLRGLLPVFLQSGVKR